jgi:hypothetical protein
MHEPSGHSSDKAGCILSKLHTVPFFAPPTQEKPLQLSEASKMTVKYKALQAVQPRQRDRKADCSDHILRDRLQHVLPNCRLPSARRPQYIPPRTRPSTTISVGSNPILVDSCRCFWPSPELLLCAISWQICNIFLNFPLLDSQASHNALNARQQGVALVAQHGFPTMDRNSIPEECEQSLSLSPFYRE